MTKRYVGLISVFLLAIPIVLIGLMATETGSHWLLARIFAVVPGEVTAKKIEGRLLDQLSLTDVTYKSDNDQVQINKLDFQWEPAQLFDSTLKIKYFYAAGITINSFGNKPDNQPKSNLADSLNLPVLPEIDNLLLTNVQFQSGEFSQHINKLQLSTKTGQQRITLQSFDIDADMFTVTSKGSVVIAQDFPVDLNLNWTVKAGENGFWKGISVMNGDMKKLNIVHQQTSPFQLTLQGRVENVLLTPLLNLQGNWQKFVWPFAHSPPQIQSPQGQFTITGLVTDYNLNINGQLSQQYLPHANLVFDGKGSQNALTIKKMGIKSETGLFHLAGDLSWGNSPSFDLKASGEKFNPAILVAELPGSLTFNSRIDGQFGNKTRQVNADINRISGQLRQQPFNASGTLALLGEQLEVNGLKIESGSNKLSVNGKIDKTKGDLSLFFNMPKLTALWPTLAGNLVGNCHVDGGWDNPAIILSAQGKQLRFAEHKAETVILNVDYSPHKQKTSVVEFSAKAISSNNILVDTLKLDGQGTLKQHDFKLDLVSKKGNLNTALVGSLVASKWKAKLVELNLTEQNGKLWSLTKTVPIQIEKKSAGLDINIEEACLSQQAASLCSRAFLGANDDISFGLTAHSLPSALLQPFLPERSKLTTLLDAQIDLHRKNHALNGNYHLTTSPALLAIQNKEFHMEASSLAGAIKGDNISANLDLHLAGNDSVFSRLMINIGKAQSVSGNITAAIADFSPLQAFVPQITDSKGQLSANLNVAGTITKPQIQGSIDLVDATVDTEQLGLRQLGFHATLNGNQGNENKRNRIRVDGSAVPVILKKNKDMSVDLKTVVNFNADVQQDSQSTQSLTGDLQLTLPTTTLAITSKQGELHNIVLTNSTVKGRLANETLVADMDIGLPEQDYLRGTLQMGIGKLNNLSGQATASIKDFKLIEALVPELNNVKGFLNANMAVTGTSQQPKINGKLHFNGGAVKIAKLGIGIRQIDLQATTRLLASDVIELRGSAQSGEGTIHLNGTVGLGLQKSPQKNFPIDLLVTGKDFEVAKLPEAQIAVSPDLKIMTADGQIKITGELTVPKAILKIQDIPENAVNVSPDEIILGEEPPKTAKITAPDLYADVQIALGKQVNFSGQGLKSDLNGNLRVVKTGNKMNMQGSVSMANATYKSYGQNLTVRKGQFIFNGPADNPWLDVEAIRLSKDKKVTAILALNGSVQNPQTHLSSEPYLPESEVLAYLITGGPLSQIGKSDSDALASAALAYGADQASWLADALGISDFSVQQGSTLKDTLLVMGKYLTPDFYMGAKVGMFNKQAVLVLKHKLIDNVNIETQAGTSQRIKMNYEFDGE
ncbi:MAG: translocation/assembly module TamB domain-containing protein [Methyloglobulus sp.]